MAGKKYAHTPGSHYADPGYQKDGKMRYPTDTPEKTQAAWGYINHPDNAAKYTPAQAAKIKRYILARYKAHGLPAPSGKDKSTSAIITSEVTATKPKVVPPDSTATHFYTAGRMITYGEPNLNGLIFFKDDCHPIIETLQHSLADVGHVKPGNGVPAINGQDNAVIGSIFEVHEDDEGIDIICKNDRDAAQGMGFTEEDFKPIDGVYSSFSQESDFSPASSPVVAVRPGVLHNINPDTDIVYEMSPDEARDRNLSTSYFDSKLGKWIYRKDEDGNTLFIRLKPISFSGVGHVIDPADKNAMIYSYAASTEGEKVIASLYPRAFADTYPSLDDPGYLPPGPESLAAGGGTLYDQGYADDDFIKHPDLSSTTKNYFAKPDGDDDDYDDEAYAALFYMPDRGEDEVQDPTQPHADLSDYNCMDMSAYSKQRLFRVKDKNGNFDRKRLIAAYHALTGMRGHTALASTLPPQVAKHALAVIRQGLEQTNPKEKQMSEIQNNPALDADIEALKARHTELKNAHDTKTAAYDTLSKEFSEYKDAQTALTAEKQAEIDALTNALKEFKDKALCSERLAALEAIFPFSTEEKADEKFEEFVKSLASVTEDRMETLMVRRELAKSKSSQEETNKSLSSVLGGRISPVPQFEGGSIKKPSIEEYL